MLADAEMDVAAGVGAWDAAGWFKGGRIEGELFGVEHVD